MGKQKLLINTVVSDSVTSNLLDVLSKDNYNVPFNFPNIGFNDINTSSSSDNKKTLPQIFNLNRELTGLCGFFPTFTRKYMYSYFFVSLSYKIFHHHYLPCSLFF